MRKDVKFGFAIGVVLLAFLVSYVMLVPADRSTRSQDTAANDDLDGNPADTPVVVSPTTAPAVAVAPTTAPSSPVAAAGSAPAGGDWNSLLTNGSTASVPALMTQTPMVGGRNTPLTSDGSAAGTDSASTDSPTVPGAPAAGASGSTSPRTHVVQAGETLSSIAAVAYGNPARWTIIASANPKVRPTALRPGTVLVLPDANAAHPVSHPGLVALAASNSPTAPAASISGKSYTVQSGDTLSRISQKVFGKPDLWQKIYDLNRGTIGSDPGRLKLHMVLKLPDTATVVQ